MTTYRHFTFARKEDRSTNSLQTLFSLPNLCSRKCQSTRNSYIDKAYRFQETMSLKDTESRYVMTKGLLDNELMTIGCNSATKWRQIRFLDEVFHKIQDFSEEILLVAGDFNYKADLQLDRTYKKTMAQILISHTFMALHDLFEKYQLVDCWRHMNPTAKDFTFYSAMHDVFSRIDYCLMLKSDMHKLKNSEVGCKLLTDHNWVTCEFFPSNLELTEYNWTLNWNLLSSQIMKQEATKAIKTYLELNDNTDCKNSIKWNALKVTLRRTWISTSTFI